MSTDNMSNPADGTQRPDSSPPPGNLQAAIGLNADAGDDPVWPKTYEAIEKAGYKDLVSPSSGTTGATGAVFKAREVMTQRRVALKVIVDPTSARSKQQLNRERKVLCVENLPSCVVRYFGCIESAAGTHQPVLVLEYISGPKIHDYARTAGRTMTERIELCRGLFDNLARLHDCGLVFGDLSPNNVLVDREGRIRFVDFGQSGRTDPVYFSANSLSAAGGTVEIAPIDILTGKRRAEPRDDVRCAAATSYLVLTGHTPDRDLRGRLREGRTRKDRFGDLVTVGVPRGIAAILVEALHDSEAALPKDTRKGEYPKARAIAERIAQWYEDRRRFWQRFRVCAAMLVVGLPLTYAALYYWQRLRLEQATTAQRSAQELDREIELRPNRNHPAVARALEAAQKIRIRWQGDVGRGDSDAAERSTGELLVALRSALTTSHEVEGVEPLRASLGEVLLRTPWTRTCPTIAAREEELGKLYRGLGESLDNGDWRGAWVGLRKLQADLALLGAENVAAKQAEQARADYRRLERGVAGRLKQEPVYQACSQRAEEGERLLSAGQFTDSAGFGAATEFGQAKAQLEAFLVQKETVEERRSRLTVDANMVAELESRITALEAEVAAANSRIESLQAQLATTEAERNNLAGGRDALQKQVTNAEQQRDAAEQARKSLAEELANATKARAAAEAEIERLRGAVAAGRVVPSGPQAMAPPQMKEQETGIGLSMIWVEPGTFQMGSPVGEKGRQGDEQLNPVTITKIFGLGKTEVTQKQWFDVKGTRPWEGQAYGVEGDDVAASYITWTDAVEFCRKLTEREQAAGRLPEGYEYRLPTEAEWERAARAGSSTRFAFGDKDSDLAKFAVYDGSRSGEHAHTVKSKQPNAWGFYDMHGNVWEWCADEVDYSPGVMRCAYKDRAVDPCNKGGPRRAYRGGGWRDSAAICRSALRYAGGPGDAYDSLGFRPALAARSDVK